MQSVVYIAEKEGFNSHDLDSRFSRFEDTSFCDVVVKRWNQRKDIH